ncbi:hypothetical protein [Paenibacillus polysaccharolyticus]|uniref:hypothetical protein n=1 Tax=Paenibacillus polysaccharolyticus TaxID=582692 RepID=UPI003008C11B
MMKVPQEFTKEFLGLHLQLNLHRRIMIGVGFSIPVYEKEYILINYEIKDNKFMGKDYLSVELELKDEEHNGFFKYTIPFITSVEYEPVGTVSQEMVKIWPRSVNPEKLEKYELYKKNGMLAELTAEEMRIEESTRMTLYPNYYEFGDIQTETEEGIVMNMADIVYTNPMFTGRSFKKNFNKISILMPFKDDFNKFYVNFLTPIINELGFEVTRGDDFFESTAVIDDIWKMINESVIIIADLTGKNANVFYEVGIAHTLGKRVILLAQNDEDIPFDLRHLRHFSYEPNSESSMITLRNNLTKAINEHKGDVNIPRDIRESIVSESESYRIVEGMSIGSTRWALQEETDSLLLFIKETPEKIKRLRNQNVLTTMATLNESQDKIIFVFSIGELNSDSEEDYILGRIPVDKEMYDFLMEVYKGNLGFYLVVANNEEQVISQKVIYYGQEGRILLFHLLDQWNSEYKNR